MQAATARQQIQQLIDKYNALSTGERRGYSETATRTNFIDPLFAALGWDMQDNAEVAREEASGSQKRVDYAFKIKGVTRFLLEAKKLDADLSNRDFARQVTDYAWNRGVDWVVLTNFRQLQILFVRGHDRTIPIISLSHEQFLTRFHELRLLSKEAAAAHELREKVVGIPPRLPVDKQLFKDLAGWRRILLQNLAQFHPEWNEQQQEEATQLILNRLIFIRNVEDRDIEERRLLPILRELEGRKEKEKLPAYLARLYRELDGIYNAQLFAEHFCEDYDGPAAPLWDMAQGLNHRIDCTPYNFAAIGVDVLGTIYEQYLTQAQSERARRRQQGIYYTPRFVVRYIVRNTIEKALVAARERGGLAAARQLRVLDPACGSGSFLIAAFDTLNDWLRANDPTLADDATRKQHILRENLYGVDLDRQAVAVTRLNLWLRAVERRAKLPDIPHIRVGNSLVDTEFDWARAFPAVLAATAGASGGFDVVIGNPPYVRQEALTAEFKQYAREKYRSYTGRADLYVCFYERAHELLRPGGYFGFVSSNKFMRADYGKGLRRYLLDVAQLEEIVDMSGLEVFSDVAVDSAIVITRKRAEQSRAEQSRAEQSRAEQSRAEQSRAEQSRAEQSRAEQSRAEQSRAGNICSIQQFLYTSVPDLELLELDEAVNQHASLLDERSLRGESWALALAEEMEIILQIQDAGTHLSEYLGKTKIRRGLTIGLNEAFIIQPGTYQRILRLNPQSRPFLHRVLRGRDIRKYHPGEGEQYLINIPKGWTREHCGDDNDPEEWMDSQHPLVMKHLAPFTERAKKRQDKGDFWWELRACAYLNEFQKPKIIYTDISTDSRFTLDRENCHLTNSAYMIPIEDLYLLGVLNSQILLHYFRHISSTLGGKQTGGLRWIHQYVSRIPIPPAPPDDPRRQTIERAVARALEIAPQEAAALPGSEEKIALRRQLDQLAAEVDAATCALYGLTGKQRERVLGS